MTIASVALRRENDQTTERLWTSRFGELEVTRDLVIDLPDGLIGFERCRRFVVVTQEESSPFRWLQSLDDGAVAFPVIDPWQFKPDYAPTISDTDAQQLGLSAETPKLTFAIVTVPKSDPHAMTANLLGPIVINAATRQGRQVIVTDEHYGTKHSIAEEVRSSGAAESEV
jgi:flagellar assembly factor FliW